MDVLFLSHCVPNPPNKGEKIRAFHELTWLAARYRIHLVCFAREPEEMDAARRLNDCCASVYVELLPRATKLVAAFGRFGLGHSLTTAFYFSPRMQARVAAMVEDDISAAVVYSSAMAQYVPKPVPMLFDMVDVDSEKWMQYGNMRWPGLPYRMEGARLRKLETAFTRRAACTFLATEPEATLLRGFVPGAPVRCVENGVDFDYFDPSLLSPISDLRDRRFVVFTGAMDYYPNADGAHWFASDVFPELRRRDPALEFWIVGRNPNRSLSRLSGRNGVTVTGSVPDIRPYLQSACAVVAPLRIARGIQNKVLEALAMSKSVLASAPVTRTFGSRIPAGLRACDGARDYITAFGQMDAAQGFFDPGIRAAARDRFSWERNLQGLAGELELLLAGTEPRSSVIASK